MASEEEHATISVPGPQFTKLGRKITKLKGSLSILQLLEFEKSSTPSFVICDQDAKI